MKAAVIVLEIYGGALAESRVLFNVLIRVTGVLDAGKHHGKVEFCVFRGKRVTSAAQNKSQMTAWISLLQVLTQVVALRRSFWRPRRASIQE